MVEFKSKIYYEEDNQIIGAEITVYSEEGDRIGNIKVTNEEDYNSLVNQIETLSEDFVSIDNLQSEIDKLNIDSNTLNGFSSADFARHEHNHGDIYVPKSHSTIIADASNYGHVKIIDNLTRDNLYTGESLSAHQGKILSDMINNLQNDLKTWDDKQAVAFRENMKGIAEDLDKVLKSESEYMRTFNQRIKELRE